MGPRAPRLQDEGKHLSDDEAIAYLISNLDGWGRRWTKPGQQVLTQREHQVVRLLVAGLTNRQIAGRLNVSERTVDGHLEHIRNKLAVRSRAQIVAWAFGPGGPARVAPGS